jgi:hypothetical protein
LSVTSIHYDVDGLAETEHRLLGIGARAIETRPLLEMFAEDLEQMMKNTFAEEGPGWEPLAPSTVERKGFPQIGRDTDAMMQSLTSESGPEAVREIFGDELIFGTALVNEEGFPYPVAFDQGTRNQPARPIFDIQEHDLRRFTKSVQAWLVGADRSEFGVGSWGMSSLVFP